MLEPTEECYARVEVSYLGAPLAANSSHEQIHRQRRMRLPVFAVVVPAAVCVHKPHLRAAARVHPVQHGLQPAFARLLIERGGAHSRMRRGGVSAAGDSSMLEPGGKGGEGGADGGGSAHKSVSIPPASEPRNHHTRNHHKHRR